MKSRRCLPVILCWCTVFVLLVAVGFVLVFVWPVLFKHILDSNMVLTKTSHTFELWKKFPHSFPIDFYFFNWTNPEDVYNETVKLKFNQMGPYKFLETKEKSDIVWNDNGTVSFKHLKHWYYDDKSSNHDIREEVTTINPVAVSAVYTSRAWSYFVRKGLSLSLSSITPTIHLTRRVGQMLFEGYKDPMITVAKTLPFLAGTSLPPWDRFGWFYTRNGSSDYEGVFNMGTGINSVFGKLYTWNYWTQTPFFEGNCAKVNGSAGEFFGPPNKESISFFSPDLCRTMTLRYSGQTVINNILGNRYVVDELMLDNGTLYPENSCFCNGECVPSGLVNVSSCRFGSPSFASLPHFYKADPYYLEPIEGLQPDKDKHDFYMVLEPTTGIPLEVSAKLQINLLMQPVSGIAMYENVPKVFIPMLWFEQSVTIPNHEAFILKLLLNLPIICTSVGVLMIFFGFIVMGCLIYKVCTMNICGRKKKKFLYSTEQSIPLKS
ncbi:hypothetical protein Zmor_025850 [Zophobas morio]|nr:hypothetical protein Zmor_025850 [Zophobas morio]